MAGSDDIAEKVADLLLEEGSRLGAHVTEQVPILVGGVSNATGKAFKKLFKDAQHGISNKKLQELEQAGTRLNMPQFEAMAKKLGQEKQVINIADSDANDLEDFIRKEKMVYVRMQVNEDDYNTFVFFSKDADKVKHARELMETRRGAVTELPANMFMEALSPDKVTVLSNVSEADTELFRHFAKEHGLMFTVLKAKEHDEARIVYRSQDAEKARQVLLSVGWALTSADGARIREQVQFMREGRSAIDIAGEEGQRELYVVSNSSPGHYIHIAGDGFELYKAGKKVMSVGRDEANFVDRCKQACLAIPSAVVLQEDEYRPDLTVQELQQMHTMDLFPPDKLEFTDDGFTNVMLDGYDALREQEELNSLYHLVAQKMALDNEGNANWGLFDSSVSFSEFAGYEHYQDEAERAGREAEFEHFKKAFSFGSTAYAPEEVDMDDKSLDYIISRAYARAGGRPEEAREPQRGHHGFAGPEPDR